MIAYELQGTPSLGVISREDYKAFLGVLNAMGPETAHPDIQPIYNDLIKTLPTFGSCVVATGLFIADRNRGGENWWPVLVRDEEFQEEHPLAHHWVVTNGEIYIDLTVADQEKELVAVGSEEEKKLVRSYETDDHSLERLQAGLSKFRDEKGRALGMTGQELYEMVYKPLLSQAVRPSRKIRVVPIAQLTPTAP
jgi:hypothetical protein